MGARWRRSSIFPISSIPAVFAVTTDPFIVLSSNPFVILGLRSLYFLLAGLLDRFIYLKTGLAALLVCTGIKVFLGLGHAEMPIAMSLAVIVLVPVTAIGASLVATHPRREELLMALVRISSGVLMGLAAAGASSSRSQSAMARHGACRWLSWPCSWDRWRLWRSG